MKRILNDYYELTVIPAIVLGCATALLNSAFLWMANGIAHLPTIGDAFGAFILFLVCMTGEDLWNAWKRLSAALDRVG